MLSAKQGNYWYHFYNVFGTSPALYASTLSLGYRGGGIETVIFVYFCKISHICLAFFWYFIYQLNQELTNINFKSS